MIEVQKIIVSNDSLNIQFRSESCPMIHIKSEGTVEWSVDNKNDAYILYVDFKFFDPEFDQICIGDFVVDLSKYVVDRNKFHDDVYMTNMLINAASRNLSPDELFFVASKALGKIPNDSPYLGALITLLSYRIIDDIGGRSFIFEDVLAKKLKFDDFFDKENPHSLRWVISSSSTFSMLCLILGKVSIAKDILVKLQRNSHLPELNPLSYWNFCQAMTLLGLIQIEQNDKRKAGNTLLRNFIFSRNSLIDIYHPRNDWLLGQLSDCSAILELGKLSLILGTKSHGNKIPGSSRISSFNADSKIVNLSPLFIRFNTVDRGSIPFFNRVLDNI